MSDHRGLHRSESPPGHVLQSPDEWAHDWALRGAILLLLAFVLPGNPNPNKARLDIGRSAWFWDAVGQVDLGYAVCVTLPLVAVIALVWAAVRMKGQARSRVLLAVSGAIFTAWLVLSPFPIDGPFVLPRTEHGALADGAPFLAFAAIAVGTHLKRRFPDSRYAKGPMLAGGAALLGMSVFVLYREFRDGIDEWGPRPIAVLSAAYALASLVAVLPLPISPRLCLLLRWTTRLMLAALLLAGHGSWKYAALLAGSAIALTLGPAASIEARLVARGTRPSQEEALVRVFE